MTHLQKKISVVIPVTKESSNPIKTIESCRFQTHKNLDIVIVAASKKCEEEVYKLADEDKRIRIIQSKSMPYNDLVTLGCEFAVGDALTVMKCGDSQDHTRIAKQSKYDISVTNIFYTDEQTMQQTYTKYLNENLFLIDPNKDILQTLIVSVDIYTEVGIFESEDWLKDWFARYFINIGKRIPILRSRLYRKEYNVGQDT